MRVNNSKERAQEVIEAIVEGHSLKDALASVGMGKTTFYRYVESDFNLQTALARAEKIRADTLADETVAIADSDDNPLRARNRIESRKWLASVYNRQKYGESIDLSVTNRVNLVDVINEARARAVPGWCQDDALEAQVVETTTLDLPNLVGSQPVTAPESVQDDEAEDDGTLADPMSLLD